jgi:hypothetical protein
MPCTHAPPEAPAPKRLRRLEVPRCRCEMELLDFLPADTPRHLLSPTRVIDPEVPEYRVLAQVLGTDACKHVLRPSLEHHLSLAEWAELACLVAPRQYAERPMPPPAIALTREARIRVYAQRRAVGLGLYNERDLWRKGSDLLNLLASRLRNGAAVEGAVAMARRIGP